MMTSISKIALLFTLCLLGPCLPVSQSSTAKSAALAEQTSSFEEALQAGPSHADQLAVAGQLGRFDCSSVADVAVADCLALVALYATADGQNWIDNSGWLASTSVCDWHGITCGSGRVTMVVLAQNGLRGAIPDEIGNLSALQILNLGNDEPTKLFEPTAVTAASLRLDMMGTIDGTSYSASGQTIADQQQAAQQLLLDIDQLRMAQVQDKAASIQLTATISRAQPLKVELLPGPVSESITESIAAEQSALNSVMAQSARTMDKRAHMSDGRMAAHTSVSAAQIDTCLLPVSTEVPAQWNILTAALPFSIAQLSDLLALNLAGTQVCGTLPAQMGQLTQLERLTINNSRLGGALPSSIGDLAQLTFIDLENNYIEGNIPSSIGNLNQLAVLNLSNNFLSGSLPIELGNLSNLIALYVRENQLFGPIPDELGLLTSLDTLDLSNNRLSGSLPSSLRNLTNMQLLSFGLNNLSGTLPNWLDEMPSLLFLSLHSNQFTGQIPQEFPPGLGYLFLAYNQLSGPIPESLGNLPFLLNIWLDNNSLNGPLPDTFANLTNLQRLSAAANQLDGPLPAWIGQLTALNYVALNANNFSGALPSSLGNLSQLEELRLNENQFSGEIPAEIDGAKRLVRLWLNTNEFQGEIPASIVNLTGLSELYLSGNNLTGVLPAGLGGLSSLTILTADNNRLSGGIPPSIGELRNLKLLLLAKNQFTGPLPTSLGNLSNAFFVALNENQLSGRIPAELGQLTAAETLFLSYNQLSGPIPPELGQLSSVTRLWLHNNQLSGAIPPELGQLSQVVSLGLEENSLSGPLPATLGELANLQELTLWLNYFSGELPPELGQLSRLTEFSVTANRLSGPLPSELEQLSNLELLGLNGNRFSGAIPDWLGNMSTLSKLFLRSNQFQGEIPTSLTNLTQLIDLNLEYNSLTSTEPSVRAFVEEHVPDWAESQTAAPGGLTAVAASAQSVAIAWDRLAYTANRGHISVEMAQSMDGPFVAIGRTPDKHSLGYTAANLEPDTTYFFRLQTYTPDNSEQISDLWSGYSTVVSTTTPIAQVTGDAYEDDNRCGQAKTVIPNGVVLERTLHKSDDVDWVRFAATAGTPYRVEVQIPDASTARVQLATATACDDELFTEENTFSYGARAVFTPTVDGSIFLKIEPETDSTTGNEARYRLSVNGPERTVTAGALILLAGRLGTDDRLQPNIHKVTNQVYDLFRQAGYGDDSIYYLATDDSLPGYDAPATAENLAFAITKWANSRVTADAPLTLYLMDHGDQGKLYLDKPSGEIISPQQLNGWLTDLEEQVVDLRSNIIIEACYAGSFLQGDGALSAVNRVVVSSTSSDEVAYASESGAHFSDHFLTALRQGHHIFSGFWEARTAVQQSHSRQVPWLDANGDGIPNTLDDAAVAAQRGYILPSQSLETRLWPPFIQRLDTTLVDGIIQIGAEVEAKSPLSRVWVTVERPDYVPPASSDQMVPEELPIVELTDPDGDGLYTGAYSQVDTLGRYRIVSYVQDTANLRARPVIGNVVNGLDDSDSSGDSGNPDGVATLYRIYVPATSHP